MHICSIIRSRINIGPVAEITFNGCPENKAYRIPLIDAARMHSIVAYGRKNIFKVFFISETFGDFFQLNRMKTL